MHNFLPPWHRRSPTLLQSKHFLSNGSGSETRAMKKYFSRRAEKAVMITKDRDFVQLLNQLGPPPKVIWVTCGNIPNAQMRNVLLQNFQGALSRLQESESLVEIPDLT